MGFLEKRLTAMQTSHGSAHFFWTWSGSPLLLAGPPWVGARRRFWSRCSSPPALPGHPPPSLAPHEAHAPAAGTVRKRGCWRVEWCRVGAQGGPGRGATADQSWATVPESWATVPESSPGQPFPGAPGPPRPGRDAYGLPRPSSALCSTWGGVGGRNGRNPRFQQLKHETAGPAHATW